MQKDSSDFTILAIDTSCDDTSVAITKGNIVLVNAISSQIEMHKKTGGVVPINAARAHDIKIEPLINLALKRTKLGLKDLDAIAVTYGPGLAPALQVGINKAKELALNLNIPLIPVNHMAGHTYGNFALKPQITRIIEGTNYTKELQDKRDNLKVTARNKEKNEDINPLVPLSVEERIDSRLHGNDTYESQLLTSNQKLETDLPIAHSTSHTNSKLPPQNIWPKLILLVSGGHTEIVLMKDHHDFEIVGETLDDACGECFDKVGRMLGLGYPAGPVIEKLAEKGDPDKYELPRPMHNTANFDVSFSGLKTAAFRLIKTIADNNKNDSADVESTKTKAPPGTEVFLLSQKETCDICASFQKAALETILIKVDKALKKYPVKELILGGGVVKNKLLRKKSRVLAKKHGIQFHYPENKLIVDNAAMIGVAAYFQHSINKNILRTKEEIENLDRKPGLRLGSI
jgi:N6-L-threonylcarbamoyladenine synthase